MEYIHEPQEVRLLKCKEDFDKFNEKQNNKLLIYELKDSKLNLNTKVKKFIKNNNEIYLKHKKEFDEAIDEIKYANYTYVRGEHTLFFLEYLMSEKIKFESYESEESIKDIEILSTEETAEELERIYNVFKERQVGFKYMYGEDTLIYDYGDVLNILRKFINGEKILANRWTYIVTGRVSLRTITEKAIKGIRNKLREFIQKHRISLIEFCMRSPKIASFSGGKDSAWMIIESMNRGITFDYIVYADTTLEFPEMDEYIDRFEKYIGQEIVRLKPKIDFDDWFFKDFSRGKNTGKIHGYPFVVGQGCWVKREMKLKQIKEFKQSLKGHYVDYIGIAYDEPERYKRMELGDKFAPLYEWRIKEKDCRDNLEKIGMLNPLYYRFKRLGCALCPKQPMDSLLAIYKYYPELWEKMKWYESQDWKTFRPDYSLNKIEELFNTKKRYVDKFALI